MFAPAKELIDQIDENETQPGNKAAILEYWYASQGQCKEAEVYFAMAREAGGEACIPADYLQGCK